MFEIEQNSIFILLIQNPHILTWSVVAILFLIAVLLERKNIIDWFRELRLKKLLGNLGRESLHGIVIPDGVEGNIFIEHLILTPQNILILSVKRFKGTIFAAESIDLWTQVVGKKSYKFENPVPQLQADVLAIKSQLGISCVDYRLIFIKGSEFPKGKPDKVISVNEIADLKRSYTAEEIPAEIRTAWKKLTDISTTDDIDIGRDVSLSNKKKKLKPRSLFLYIAILWLVWRYFM